jgi:hypothetical protein
VSDKDLTQKYTGLLQVSIKSLGHKTIRLNNKPLFDFVRLAYSDLISELQKVDNAQTKIEDWEVVAFLPAKCVLHVKKVSQTDSSVKPPKKESEKSGFFGTVIGGIGDIAESIIDGISDIDIDFD